MIIKYIGQWVTELVDFTNLVRTLENGDTIQVEDPVGEQLTQMYPTTRVSVNEVSGWGWLPTQELWYNQWVLSDDMLTFWVGWQQLNAISGQATYDLPSTADRLPQLPNEVVASWMLRYVWLVTYLENGIEEYEWIISDNIDTDAITLPLTLWQSVRPWWLIVRWVWWINATGGDLTIGIDGKYDWFVSVWFPKGWGNAYLSANPTFWYDFSTNLFRNKNEYILNHEVINANDEILYDFIDNGIIPNGETVAYLIVNYDREQFLLPLNATQYQFPVWLIYITNNTGWNIDITSTNLNQQPISIQVITYSDWDWIGDFADEIEISAARIEVRDGMIAYFDWSWVNAAGTYMYRAGWRQVLGWNWVPPTVAYLTGTNNLAEAEFDNFENTYNYLSAWLAANLPKTMYVQTSSVYPVLDEGVGYNNTVLRMIGNMSSANVWLPATLSINNSSHWAGDEMRWSLPSYLEGIQLLLNADNSGWVTLWDYNLTPFDINMVDSSIENWTSAYCYNIANWSYRMTLRGKSWLVCTSWALFSISSWAFLRVDLYDDSYLSWEINQNTITPDQMEIHIHSPNVKISSDYINGVNCKIIFHTFNSDNIAQFATKGYGNVATTTDTIVDAVWDDVNKQMTIEVWTWPVANIANVWDRVNVASLLMTGGTADWAYMYVTAIDIGNDTMTIQFPMGSVDFWTYTSWGTVTKQDVRSIGYMAEECNWFNWNIKYDCTGAGNHNLQLVMSVFETGTAPLLDSWTLTADTVWAEGTLMNEGLGDVRASYLQTPVNTGMSMWDYLSAPWQQNREIVLVMDAPNDNEITVKTFTIGN